MNLEDTTPPTPKPRRKAVPKLPEPPTAAEMLKAVEDLKETAQRFEGQVQVNDRDIAWDCEVTLTVSL